MAAVLQVGKRRKLSDSALYTPNLLLGGALHTCRPSKAA